MVICTRAIVSVVLAAVLLAASATLARAQTTARVSAAGAKIWAPNFQSAIAEVPRGAILTVVGRRADWVEVEVPDGKGGGRGFVFAANLDLTGKAFPAASFPAAPESPASPAPTPQVSSLVRNSPRSYGVRGFGQFGYTSFAAQQSFNAVLGQSGGLMLGGGAEVRFGAGLFVMGSIERFNKIGERAFVFSGEVYQLGIPNTITMTPLAVTVGWRRDGNLFTPYGGGGFGRVRYTETSDFAEADENVEGSFSSYHALGGIEFRNGWVATAFEAQYTQVPDALGAGGVSAAFQEHNLGGLTARVKVLVGK
jgi:hypothetical protein